MGDDPAAWEHLVEREPDQARLSALGAEGWELVTVRDVGGEARAYLKRPALSFRERVTLEQRDAYYGRQGAGAGVGATDEDRRSVILHPALKHLLASIGHTDYLTICDRGFPVPPAPPRIDLALVDDLPTVLDVLGAVLVEWSVDRVLITEEMVEVSPERVEALRALLGAIPLEVVAHLGLKRLAANGRATVRTGDTTPYANLILVGG